MEGYDFGEKWGVRIAGFIGGFLGGSGILAENNLIDPWWGGGIICGIIILLIVIFADYGFEHGYL